MFQVRKRIQNKAYILLLLMVPITIVCMENTRNQAKDVPSLQELAARAYFKKNAAIPTQKEVSEAALALLEYYQPLTDNSVLKIVKLANTKNDAERKQACIKFLTNSSKIRITIKDTLFIHPNETSEEIEKHKLENYFKEKVTFPNEELITDLKKVIVKQQTKNREKTESKVCYLMLANRVFYCTLSVVLIYGYCLLKFYK